MLLEGLLVCTGVEVRKQSDLLPKDLFDGGTLCHGGRLWTGGLLTGVGEGQGADGVVVLGEEGTGLG